MLQFHEVFYKSTKNFVKLQNAFFHYLLMVSSTSSWGWPWIMELTSRALGNVFPFFSRNVMDGLINFTSPGKWQKNVLFFLKKKVNFYFLKKLFLLTFFNQMMKIGTSCSPIWRLEIVTDTIQPWISVNIILFSTSGSISTMKFITDFTLFRDHWTWVA